MGRDIEVLNEDMIADTVHGRQGTAVTHVVSPLYRLLDCSAFHEFKRSSQYCLTSPEATMRL
jgi:hypothetical protein